MSVKLLQQAVLGCDGCGATLATKPEVMQSEEDKGPRLVVPNYPAFMPPESKWVRLIGASVIQSPFDRPKKWDLCPSCYERARRAIETSFRPAEPLQ